MERSGSYCSNLDSFRRFLGRHPHYRDLVLSCALLLNWQVGEFDKALYFSVVTATTLEYGNLTVSKQWRLLASFEAMGGLILFGAGTASLFAMTRPLVDHELSLRKK